MCPLRILLSSSWEVAAGIPRWGQASAHLLPSPDSGWPSSVLPARIAYTCQQMPGELSLLQARRQLPNKHRTHHWSVTPLLTQFWHGSENGGAAMHLVRYRLSMPRGSVCGSGSSDTRRNSEYKTHTCISYKRLRLFWASLRLQLQLPGSWHIR